MILSSASVLPMPTLTRLVVTRSITTATWRSFTINYSSEEMRTFRTLRTTLLSCVTTSMPQFTPPSISKPHRQKEMRWPPPTRDRVGGTLSSHGVGSEIGIEALHGPIFRPGGAPQKEGQHQ